MLGERPPKCVIVNPLPSVSLVVLCPIVELCLACSGTQPILCCSIGKVGPRSEEADVRNAKQKSKPLPTNYATLSAYKLHPN